MSKSLWLGVGIGVLATLLVLGGLLVASAAAGMGPAAGMGGMAEDCAEMMADHRHHHDHGNETRGGDQGNETRSETSAAGLAEEPGLPGPHLRLRSR